MAEFAIVSILAVALSKIPANLWLSKLLMIKLLIMLNVKSSSHFFRKEIKGTSETDNFENGVAGKGLQKENKCLFSCLHLRPCH